MSTQDLLPGTIYDDQSRLLIPIELIVENSDNPRDPIETDYKDEEFRILVENIRVQSNGLNHTPIQVYMKDGKYHLIAGHRRTKAVIKASELNMEEWAEHQVGIEPIPATHIFATLMPAPLDDFELKKMMFSAEETSKRWGEIRRFVFFKSMAETQPAQLRANPVMFFERMKSATGLPKSTVNTYCGFLTNKKISEAMSDLSNSQIPRSGRMKSIRACLRGVEFLSKERPHLVKQVTLAKPEQQLYDTFVQNQLAKLFLDKLKEYVKMRETGEIGLGAGVALERIVGELKAQEGGPIEDYEIGNWLTQKGAKFRDDIIHQRHRRQKGQENSSSFLSLVKQQEVPSLTSIKSPEELQKFADDFIDCSDYFNDLAKKFRDALRKRTDG